MAESRLVILLITAFHSVTCSALSPDAVEGKSLYPACHVCHAPAMDPPLGPPMWGVQRRYKRNALDKADFVASMANFVKAPTLEIAIHDEAVAELGLMPPMPLPDEMLRKIATYIFEEQFPPPCEHWRIAANRMEEKGDIEHAKRAGYQLERFCN